MKFMKNQNGYALLIVLLMVVLFMGLAATFMAGSLSNAKQERIVDTSNQAVASAEMGVSYFSTDFQRDLKIVTKEVSEKTMEELLELRECFKVSDPRCDSQIKIAAEEAKIDNEMLDLYILRIMNKVDLLISEQGKEIVPFTSNEIVYSIQSATGVKLNQHGEDITAADVTDTKISSIEVRLVMEGESAGVSRTLEAKFDIEVPPTFLNNSNPLTVYTEKVVQDGVQYSDVFKDMPNISCTDLITALEDKDYTGLKECSLTGSETMQSILNKIETAKLDPELFTVYTDAFLTNVCPSSGNPCSNVDFKGITIAVAADDVSATNNMNNLTGANIIINGLWSAENNLQNLGKHGPLQTIVLHELTVGNNFPGMVNTNLIILGKEEGFENSRINFTEIKNSNKSFNVGGNSRFCIDIDKIVPSDLDIIKEVTSFETKENSEGLLIYFSRNINSTFKLDGTVNKATAEERNKHVLFEPDYTTFLKACGLTIERTIIDMTEVSIVDNLDPGFELDVEY